MLGWLRNLLGGGAGEATPPAGPGDKALAKRYLALVKGRYDAAVTNDDNRRHWANADGLSADAAASADVRCVLRNRSRYEVQNNCYARGLAETLAADTIGTGPRLQLLTEGSELNRQVERDWEEWSATAALAQKLRVMRKARFQDGEAFAILRDNPSLGSRVTLDLALVEADRVTSPLVNVDDENEVDGILLDERGNPTAYRVLKRHPGGTGATWREEFERVPAASMIHLFRMDRPGQHRGVPEITPALPLYALLRRYTLAVVTAAEFAAEISGVLKADAPPGEADVSNSEAMDVIEAERNLLVQLPLGWDVRQFEPTQPADKYVEFKRAVLNEIARCVGVPYNIAACDSAGYNYASGRLDHQTYFKSIRVDQAFFARTVLDRILKAWLWEYSLVEPTALPLLLRDRVLPRHQWFWDGTEHVDPLKEAKGQGERLGNLTTTLAEEYARQGKDWEAELRQRAREKALMAELGLTEEEAAPRKQELDEDELAERVAEEVASA